MVLNPRPDIADAVDGPNKVTILEAASTVRTFKRVQVRPHVLRDLVIALALASSLFCLPLSRRDVLPAR